MGVVYRGACLAGVWWGLFSWLTSAPQRPLLQRGRGRTRVPGGLRPNVGRSPVPRVLWRLCGPACPAPWDFRLTVPAPWGGACRRGRSRGHFRQLRPAAVALMPGARVRHDGRAQRQGTAGRAREAPAGQMVAQGSVRRSWPGCGLMCATPLSRREYTTEPRIEKLPQRESERDSPDREVCPL